MTVTEDTQGGDHGNVSQTPGVHLSHTDNVDAVSRNMYKAFANEPANDYLMKKFFNIPINNNEPVSKYRIHALMHLINAFYYDRGAELVQANSFHATAIWTHPNNPVDFPRTNDDRFNSIFFDQLSTLKNKIMPPGMKYYYLFCIGRDPSNKSTTGSVRSIFQYYKSRADAENVAICLEAINEHAKSVYEYFGFKNYLTFKYGVGEVDSNGHPNTKGEGFTGYLMIYHKDADTIFNPLY